MTGFFDKLSTLLRARIHDVVDRVEEATRLTPAERRPQGDQVTVDALRERINKAIEYESKLRREIDELDAEIEALNRKADEAVESGNEAMARHFVKQMQGKQRRREFASADLKEHQRIAESLILEVNRLDATLSGDQQTNDTEIARHEAEESTETEHMPGMERLTRVFHDAQSHIQSVGERLRARQMGGETFEPEDESRTEAEVEDDLEARRNRLMKK